MSGFWSSRCGSALKDAIGSRLWFASGRMVEPQLKSPAGGLALESEAGLGGTGGLLPKHWIWPEPPVIMLGGGT